MSMGDSGNGALADAPLPRVAPTVAGRADTCATCERPAAPGKLRCDTCVDDEYNHLRATFGEEWYDRHKQWRRGEAGHAEP